MTFGIDTAGYQVGLDMAAARAEGTEFNIVKAVAAFRPEHTVADGYHSNIDRTLAAGIPGKGHYLVPNSRNTPEASAVFLAENVHRYSGGDVLALDNEPLDTYPVFWRDAEAARFFRRLHAELGHPYERMWLYCPASLTRANGPWPECAALGIKFWWSAYGDYPTGHTPDHEPSLQGAIPRWDVHQYSSAVWVAGDQVDGNFSRATITDLFGGLDMGYLEVRPARGNINTPFGPRPKPTPTSPAIHYGQDYGWGGGDQIYAARSGLVAEYASAGSYGNRMILVHDDGKQTWYCHLSSAVAAVGSLVSAGQQIAWMGATGNVTGKHLHFELRVGGVATDPEPYFAGGSTAGGGNTPIEEDEMALLPDERDWLFNVNSAVQVMIDARDAALRAEKLLAQPVARDLDGDGEYEFLSRIQDDADTNTMVRELLARDVSAGVDVPALVAALAPAVVAGVLEGIPAGGDLSADEIAELVVTKFAARLS